MMKYSSKKLAPKAPKAPKALKITNRSGRYTDQLYDEVPAHCRMTFMSLQHTNTVCVYSYPGAGGVKPSVSRITSVGKKRILDSDTTGNL